MHAVLVTCYRCRRSSCVVDHERMCADAVPGPRDASADLSLCSGSCYHCSIVALVWSTMSACALMPCPTTTRCVGGLFVSVGGLCYDCCCVSPCGCCSCMLCLSHGIAVDVDESCCHVVMLAHCHRFSSTSEILLLSVYLLDTEDACCESRPPP